MAKPQILKHMMPRDIPVWATYYLSPEGQSYTAWEFDVLVGKPTDPGAFYPDSTRKQAMYLSALKIDAVGWLYNTPALIECKPDADLGAIGQIVGYQRWYEIIFLTRPRGIIVCESMREQVQIIANLLDIDVKIVPPANEYQVKAAIESVRGKIQHLSVLPELPA